MTSHYDKTQPGQYTPPFPENRNPGKYPKKKMPLGAKIALFVVGIPMVIVGGCAAIVGGSLAAETVANSGADPAPVISTQTPVARETPRAPKPVEQAPTKKPTRTAPARTMAQEQAIGAAESYLNVSAFSRKGLINQLSSAYGEGFTVADSTYAVDHITVDWNEQAAKSAKSYLQVTNFSRKGLIEQLESSSGEGFTHAQAVYGTTKAGL